MSSSTTAPSDLLTNDPVLTYVPVPFPASYPYNNKVTASTGSGGGTGTGGGGTDSGNVYAQALFLNAYCQASDIVGSWVRAADAASTVTTTTCSLSYPAIGVIVSKNSDTTCVVQTYGLCTGVYSNLTPNLRMFVGPGGQATLGSALPSGTAYVQPIGFSVRADTIFVQPSGTLYRRDAQAAATDPAPPPASSDSVSTYRPMLHGVGAPDQSVGQLDDAYLATDTLYLYLKTDTGWDAGRPFGGAGQAGQQGPAGTPGNRIYRVPSIPSDLSLYNVGDFLIADNFDAVIVTQT